MGGLSKRGRCSFVASKGARWGVLFCCRLSLGGLSFVELGAP